MENRPEWFDYIRVRERRIIGTNKPPDFIASFGPQNILTPEPTEERMRRKLDRAKDWLWMWMEKWQPMAELVKIKVAANKFLDYCEAHNWGYMPEPHDSVRDLLALLDRKTECHGDVKCATCGLPIACDGRHKEKQYCTERCEILDCASPKHPGCEKCEVKV